LRYHFETCTFIKVESTTKPGSEIALNFVLIHLISQP
jgi:hypothetical protein